MARQPNLFLVGPMGAGKTTIGKRLAQIKGMEFIDSDHEIEARTGVDIPYIFEKEGETGFRKRERDIINELTQQENIVLATGGGAILHPDNRRDLANRGIVIYLHATIEQQLERTRSSTRRPLLQVDDPRAQLEKLIQEREPLYREIADIVIETDGQQTRNLARVIADRLDQLVPN